MTHEAGKGSAQRPSQVSNNVYQDRYDAIFRKRNEDIDAGIFIKTKEDYVKDSEVDKEYIKPAVHFIKGTESFYEAGPDMKVARLRAIDHPTLGAGIVRTSLIVKEHDDGSFETLNTIYKPLV
jgi:hypothetical protein